MITERSGGNMVELKDIIEILSKEFEIEPKVVELLLAEYIRLLETIRQGVIIIHAN